MNVSAAIGAFQRIEKLLGAPEATILQDSEDIPFGTIKIENASFSWESAGCRDYFAPEKNSQIPNPETDEILEMPAILKNINVTFEAGKFSIIVGQVGSGKSSI